MPTNSRIAKAVQTLKTLEADDEAEKTEQAEKAKPVTPQVIKLDADSFGRIANLSQAEIRKFTQAGEKVDRRADKLETALQKQAEKLTAMEKRLTELANKPPPNVPKPPPPPPVLTDQRFEISHTVDGEIDSVTRITRYAGRKGEVRKSFMVERDDEGKITELVDAAHYA